MACLLLFYEGLTNEISLPPHAADNSIWFCRDGKTCRLQKRNGVLRPMNAEQVQVIDRRSCYRIEKRKCQRRNRCVNAAFSYENRRRRRPGLGRVVRRRYLLLRHYY